LSFRDLHLLYLAASGCRLRSAGQVQFEL